VDLLVTEGKSALDKLPEGIREDAEAMSETIENNIRKVIIDEQPVNPKYYEKMSELLDALIQQRKEEALDYKAYLEELVELAGKVQKPSESDEYPGSVNTPAKRALYDNLDRDEVVAIRVDDAVRRTRKDDWRGNRFKEREVRNVVREELGKYETRAHGHVLTPGRYVGAEAAEEDSEPFEEKMRRLAAQWREQQAEARRLDAAIEANLETLGYAINE
jgi:type I restriction enzyme, R subunit